MATYKYGSYGSLADVIATASLNSLADDGTATGSVIDNTTNRYPFMKVEINLASVDLSAQTSPGVELYLIESADGTNYEDDDEAGTYCITIPVAATNAAHRKTSGTIMIPPAKFKLRIKNVTGAAFASSGNTCQYTTWTTESA